MRVVRARARRRPLPPAARKLHARRATASAARRARGIAWALAARDAGAGAGGGNQGEEIGQSSSNSGRYNCTLCRLMQRDSLSRPQALYRSSPARLMRSRSRASRRRSIRVAVVSATAPGCAAAGRGDRLVRARSCASACCPTGRRCPTTSSRRTTISSPSAWRRSIASSAASSTSPWCRRRPRSCACARRPTSPAHTFFLRTGETELDVEQLKAQLATAGYQHVTQVVAPGEFCVRGGLIDLFPMGSALPYRLDLDDEVIDSIRTFDVDTQRTRVLR